MFQIPADVVRALGRGDPALGLAVLHHTLGVHPFSGPPGQVSTDKLKEIGGDVTNGKRVLQRFVSMIRRGKKSNPGRMVLIKGNRADIAISVDTQ